MLKLMPPENNSNVSQPDASSADKTSPAPAGSGAKLKSGQSKSWLKYGLITIVAVVVLVVVAAVAYKVGKGHKVVATPTTTTITPKAITLPPQAIVTSQCTPGRGKQYIIPKDIPQGPIYDVQNNKVIAIEYVLNLNQLFQNSDTFSSAILQLTKNYPVDHFTLVPDTTQATSPTAVQNIHLIMFVVKQTVADSITCTGSTTTGSTSTTTPTSSSSSTSSSTSRTTP